MYTLVFFFFTVVELKIFKKNEQTHLYLFFYIYIFLFNANIMIYILHYLIK